MLNVWPANCWLLKAVKLSLDTGYRQTQQHNSLLLSTNDERNYDHVLLSLVIKIIKFFLKQKQKKKKKGKLRGDRMNVKRILTFTFAFKI